MDNSKMVDVLNELIETSVDGKKGFAEASEKVTDASLKVEMSHRSQECALAAQQLESVVRAMGGTPATCGSVAGAAHRGWVAVKAAVADSNVAVLEEVERGEDHAKAEFRKALALDLPADARRLVESQYDGCMRNHDRIRELRDSYARAT